MARGLDPRTYTDAAILAEEQARIFGTSWHFVGLKPSLARHNDWLTAILGGRSILVQNFDGHLRGFRNVCSHRHARLKGECHGNSVLRCPYHGWTYNSEGVPIGIPGNAQYFGLDAEARRALSLPPVAVECCGDLVFARIAAEGPDLAAFLGPYFELFAGISTALATPFAEGEAAWRCNWKLGIESAIEGYHLAQIHPETFKPFVDAVLPASWNGDHSLGPSSLSASARDSLARIEDRLGLARLDGAEHYEHYFVFPNLCLTVTAGLTFSLQTYEPVGPGETRLRYHLLTGASDRPARRDGIMGKAVLGAFGDFNDKVLEEDRRISEEVQAGKAFSPLPPAMLGRNEDRILAFHDAWRRAMADSWRS